MRNAQMQAVDKLRRYPSERTRKALIEAIQRKDNFYR